jgi:calcium-dependent protein kinase
MICGYSPFRGDTYQKIMEENKNALLSFDRSVWKEVSKECKDLIRRMAEPDPQLRISFDKAMEHPVKYHYNNNFSGL